MSREFYQNHLQNSSVVVHNKHVLFDPQQRQQKKCQSDQPDGSTQQIPIQMTTTVGQLDNFDPNKEH